jgi:putative acyl-CoA dehydrogenase
MTDPFATHEVFNQTPPYEDVNLFATDGPLRRALGLYAPEAGTAELSGFGGVAGSAEAAEWARLANEYPPVLETHDVQGRRADRVRFHPAYHELMRTSFAHGVHKLEAGANAHVLRAAKLYLAAQMESGHCCPITMTHAAVPVLARESRMLAPWLIKANATQYDQSFKPAAQKASVTIGMGMTEKQGGSDVRANTTRAAPAGASGPGQTYEITGHKWFMSAPMCDAFLILAQAKCGLTCFFMPRFRDDGQLNAIHFQRLKPKLGNRSNASSEVEFHAAQAVALGEEGRGTSVIIGMVSLTRLDCALSSAAMMRQAFAHALHHARHRTAFQRKLIDQPLMLQVLAGLALDVEAAVALSFRLARAFDEGQSDGARAWRRLMVPIVKYWVCKTAPPFVAEAMECLGGNGYVETGPLARIYREVPVNAIWEGSGNIMALDVMRVLRREPELAHTLLDDFSAVPELAGIASDLSALLLQREGEALAREIVERFAVLAAARLLLADAPQAVADAFVAHRLAGVQSRIYGASHLAHPVAVIEAATSGAR